MSGDEVSKRTNAQWLSDLSEPGFEQETALADLRSIIRAGLPYALSKWLSPSDPKFDALIDEATQDTLLRVLESLGTFEGRSKFTTWVQKIAVRVALTELRRKRWRDYSLDDLLEEERGGVNLEFKVDRSRGPELAAEQSDLISRVQRVILEELTEKQRTVLVAGQVHGMPLEEVARRMGRKRNALYKLMHEARLRMKRRLAEEGLSPEDILRAFEAK
jgi:RNA polymerase sigma-70 factor (ECF subfamily)